MSAIDLLANVSNKPEHSLHRVSWSPRIGKGEQTQCGQYGDKSGCCEKETQTGDTKLLSETKVNPLEKETGTKPDGLRRAHRRE